MDKENLNIGDKVWLAKSENRQVTETCLICFGKLSVILTLGNDEQVKLPCEYCAKGSLYGPQGVVTDWEYVADCEEVVIDRKEVKEFDGKKEVSYRSDNYYLEPERIFETKEQAEEWVALEIKKQYDLETIRKNYIKYDDKKNYAWHAGYHRKAIRDAEKQIKYHTPRVVVCKERTKEEKEQKL